MITRLQGRDMTNEKVLQTLYKVCNKFDQKLIHASYDADTLRLVVLIDSEVQPGAIGSYMDDVLIGLRDFDLCALKDTTLQLVDEPFCPATTVTDDEEEYYEIVELDGGVKLI